MHSCHTLNFRQTKITKVKCLHRTLDKPFIKSEEINPVTEN